MTISETIAPTYQWATFESSDLSLRVRPATAIAEARTAVQDPVVLITGPTGVGKTALAVAMVRSVLGARYIFGFSSRAFYVDWHDQLKLRDEALRAPALLIDDLQTPRPADKYQLS